MSLSNSVLQKIVTDGWKKWSMAIGWRWVVGFWSISEFEMQYWAIHYDENSLFVMTSFISVRQPGWSSNMVNHPSQSQPDISCYSTDTPPALDISLTKKEKQKLQVIICLSRERKRNMKNLSDIWHGQELDREKLIFRCAESGLT